MSWKSGHGGNLWALLEESDLSADQVLDFSADLNPMGPPPNFKELLEAGCESVRWYPDPDYLEFREAAAGALGIDPANVLPGNGTADLIHLISRLYARSQAVVVAPTFTEYERAVAADGGHPMPWLLKEENGFAPPDLNESFPLEGSRLLFVCNPNNPTGTLWSRERLVALLELCRNAGITVVVDEAYLDLIEDAAGASAVSFIHRFPQLIVLRSLTKSFAVPGLRAGYLVAAEPMVGRLKSVQPPWSMNALSAALATGWIQRPEILAEARQALKEFRSTLWEGLKRIPGLRPFPSKANFFLCRITDPAWTNDRLAECLRRKGILIRICDDFTGLAPGRFIRLAVRRPEENERLLNVLKDCLGHAG